MQRAILTACIALGPVARSIAVLVCAAHPRRRFQKLVTVASRRVQATLQARCLKRFHADEAPPSGGPVLQTQALTSVTHTPIRSFEASGFHFHLPRSCAGPSIQ